MHTSLVASVWVVLLEFLRSLNMLQVFISKVRAICSVSASISPSLPQQYAKLRPIFCIVYRVAICGACQGFPMSLNTLPLSVRRYVPSFGLGVLISLSSTRISQIVVCIFHRPSHLCMCGSPVDYEVCKHASIISGLKPYPGKSVSIYSSLRSCCIQWVHQH